MSEAHEIEIELASSSGMNPEAEILRRETVEENPLSIDVIYLQRFTLLQRNKASEFKQSVLKYVNSLLNDEKFGIVFFKARIFSNREVNPEDSLRVGDNPSEVEYLLHFHAFAEEYLTDEKVRMIKFNFLPQLLKDSNGEPLAKLTATELIIHEDTDFRSPVYV